MGSQGRELVYYKCSAKCTLPSILLKKTNTGFVNLLLNCKFWPLQIQVYQIWNYKQNKLLLLYCSEGCNGYIIISIIYFLILISIVKIPSFCRNRSFIFALCALNSSVSCCRCTFRCASSSAGSKNCQLQGLLMKSDQDQTVVKTDRYIIFYFIQILICSKREFGVFTCSAGFGNSCGFFHYYYFMSHLQQAPEFRVPNQLKLLPCQWIF